MNKPLIIFGNKDTAEMAAYYWGHRAKAFVMDNPESDMFYKRPMLDFANIQETCPPHIYDMFVPIVDNKVRKRIYDKVKSLGYNMPSYIHPSAHVWDKSAIGENCFIQELNNIQFRTTVGNNCILWAGNHIGHHGCIRDHVFITSHVTVSGHCDIQSYSYLGVNSTIKDFTVIPENTFIGMGSVVNKPIHKPNGVYVGAPAKRLRDVD